jgi:hypothetical protein
LSHFPAQECLEILVCEALIGGLRPQQPPCQAQQILLLQALQILVWIVQPIRMIDAQAVHLALAEQAQDQLVSGREDLRFFHAERGQVIDVKEPPVVDFF